MGQLEVTELLKWSNVFCLAAFASALMKNPIMPISAPINAESVWDTSGLQRWDNISSTYNPILMLLALWTWTNTLSCTHLTHYEVSSFTHTTHLLSVASGRMVLAEWRWAEDEFVFFFPYIVVKLEISLHLLKFQLASMYWVSLRIWSWQFSRHITDIIV